jgi:hypothetical protein
MEGHRIRVGARGCKLLALRQVITVTNISVLYPLSINTLSVAAAKAGAAASNRDQQKRMCASSLAGYAFVLFSVERYEPVMKLLHDLGDKAAGSAGLTWVDFVAGALRELSVGLIREFFSFIVPVLEALTRVTGRSFRIRMTVPTDEPPA